MQLPDFKKLDEDAAVNIDVDHTVVPGDVVQEILKLNLASKTEAANSLLVSSILWSASAAKERDDMAEWAWERAQKHGSKGGSKPNILTQILHDEWQRMADRIWSRRPLLSINDVAKIIQDYADQSWYTIRKYINK